MGSDFSSKRNNFIHPVAQAYFDRIIAAGGNVVDKDNINNFVEGLCRIIDPSLWVFWPLISTQNIGTGSTVFSVGNLVRNGTLVNGPAWSTAGFSFDAASTQSITLIPNQQFDVNVLSDITIVKFPTTGTGFFSRITGITQAIDLYWNFAFSYFGQYFLSHNTTRGGSAVNTQYFNSITGVNQYRMGGISLIDPNTDVFYFSGAKVNTTSGLTTRNPVNTITTHTLFQTGPGAADVSICPFKFLCMKPLNDSEHLAIYNLYKSTLGSTLSLP